MSVPVRTRGPSLDDVWRRARQAPPRTPIAGSYVYFCTVSRHRKASMRSRLDLHRR